jgi:hypothetical protein
MKYLLLALMLFAGTLPAQTLCTKNLGTLTERQFDNAYLSLLKAVDRQLLKTGKYTLDANGYPATYEANATVDVTRESPNVVSYTVCRLTSLGIQAQTQTSGGKTYLVARIYTVF